MILNQEGQASMEYLMIMAIAMLILLPLVSIVYSQTARTRKEMGLSALQDSLEGLSDSANLVQAQGNPAKITRKLYLPDGTLYSNVTEHHFIVRVETKAGPTDYSSKTSASLVGEIPEEAGTYKISLKMEEEGVVNVTF